MKPASTKTILTDLTKTVAARASRGVRRRRRWTTEQKDDFLARFSTSGVTASEFCRRSGLSAVTFSAWRRQRPHALRPAAKVPRTQFAEVRLGALFNDAPLTPGAVLHLPAGRRLSLTVGTDPHWIAQVVQALEQVSGNGAQPC